MLLRLSTLATGRTGVRLEIAEVYAAMLNAGITPVVHEFGSLGCSGDLAPLAHCALAAMGEGTVRVNTGRVNTGRGKLGALNTTKARVNTGRVNGEEQPATDAPPRLADRRRSCSARRRAWR